MKVVTIKQPFASLIMCGYKKYEFRSWKTKYRGEIYIHAGKGINKSRMELVEEYNLDYPNGYIIAKANLVDCILVDKQMNELLKKENPKVYSHNYEGHYAWVLEDIKPLENKIQAKGSLSIWNYYEDKEIMKLMETIEYGWVDKYNKKHIFDYETYSDEYMLQSPKQIIKNKIGVCWDQVELERYYFKNSDLNIKTYFIVSYDDDKCPTHTFLTYEKDNKYYWLEHSWERFRGIHQYNSQKELLLDVRNKFIKHELNNDYDKNKLFLYEYTKPKYNISTEQFYKHCENGKNIKLD